MTEDPRVQRLLDELLDSDAAPEQVCASCPELLPQVRTRWRQMRRLGSDLDVLFPARNERTAGEPELPQVQGYEVLAVLGRGGMGVVFRARHLRLNRPVALKMILAGPWAMRDELDRFVREAQAVAGLSHPNIVQVYDSGELDGRPYYTMEFVEGGSLAQKIAGSPQPARQSAILVAILADAIQVAHQHGIIHRDLTPANILLTSDGTPKVADFGLARRVEDSGMTHTGLPMGTPSYMAPEQAKGEKATIGPATDVYALGAILYHLLTGRPPFRAETATATLRQVISDEPVPPARLNPQVPRDLETICLTCLRKEPTGRYASAAALAEDLRRFERGEPIAARPLGRLARLGRWARRRPTAAALYVALCAAALLLLALVGIELRMSGQQLATDQAAALDLRDADQLVQQSDFIRARQALERAEGRLAAGGSPDLRQRVGLADVDLRRREVEADRIQKLKLRLETIRMDRCNLVEGHLDRLRSDREYAEAFRSAGLANFDELPAAVAERVKQSPARQSLVAALDDWAICAANKLRRDWVLGVARLSDPDPWRNRARDPAGYWDLAKLKDLTASAPDDPQSVQLLVSVGERFLRADSDAAIPFLRKVQQEHPDDFYANFWLGYALPPTGEEISYFRVAFALRPDAAVASYNLGLALSHAGRNDEALPYLFKAVRLNPQYAFAHAGLGEALLAKGRADEAISQYREALRLEPRMTVLYWELGRLLSDRGQLPEATDAFQHRVALTPDDKESQEQLRQLLIRQGRLEEARTAWHKALEQNPSEHDDWFGYAELCLFLGNEDEYRRDCRALLARFGNSTDPTICERTGRACLLSSKDQDLWKEGAALADRAIALKHTGPAASWPYYIFAQALGDYRRGRFDDAISLMNGEAADATMMGPSQRLVTAMALYRKGQKDEATKTLAAAVLDYDWSAAKANSRDPWIAHILRREAESLIQPDSLGH